MKNYFVRHTIGLILGAAIYGGLNFVSLSASLVANKFDCNALMVRYGLIVCTKDDGLIK